jgi:hypothetical protein
MVRLRMMDGERWKLQDPRYLRTSLKAMCSVTIAAYMGALTPCLESTRFRAILSLISLTNSFNFHQNRLEVPTCSIFHPSLARVGISQAQSYFRGSRIR